jgi:hypothetical protein
MLIRPALPTEHACASDGRPGPSMLVLQVHQRDSRLYLGVCRGGSSDRRGACRSQLVDHCSKAVPSACRRHLQRRASELFFINFHSISLGFCLGFARELCQIAPSPRGMDSAAMWHRPRGVVEGRGRGVWSRGVVWYPSKEWNLTI